RPRAGGGDHDDESRPADAMQMLAAEMLLFTGLGAAAETLRVLPAPGFRNPDSGPAAVVRRLLESRPIAWAPAILGPLAALAHAAHAVAPTERTRMATRAMDVAVVGAGLLGLTETLAARRDGEVPSTSPLALASAG